MSRLAIFFRCTWYVLTLRCEEADGLRSRSQHESLSRSERLGEALHAFGCSSCRRARRQLRALRGLVEDIEAHTPSMPQDARERIRSRLKKN